jgi:hypothetical protein
VAWVDPSTVPRTAEAPRPSQGAAAVVLLQVATSTARGQWATGRSTLLRRLQAAGPTAGAVPMWPPRPAVPYARFELSLAVRNINQALRSWSMGLQGSSAGARDAGGHGGRAQRLHERQVSQARECSGLVS